MLDWLIIGGGIHGVHVAARLLGEGGAQREHVRILDPSHALLTRWRTCTSTTGMTHLRSAAVHHLDIHPWSLQRFAGDRRTRPPGLFARPYDRPSLELFDAHCDRVISRFGLDGLHVRGRAEHIHIVDEGVTACVAGATPSTLQAHRVVLALGSSERPQWPEWAPHGHTRVQHIFSPDFTGWPEPHERDVAVVGGGISAGQVALKLAARGHTVHLVSRHPLRTHQFDSDSGWLGPKRMRRFSRESDPKRRRDMITQARHRGSVPPDVQRRLRRAMTRGEVVWHEAHVEVVTSSSDTLNLRLSTGQDVEVSRVLLATGFSSERPGGALVQGLVDSNNLPCSVCGYPIVDESLGWHPRVHVTGPLAELELGPASRNIAGARRAGDRLVRVARENTPIPSQNAS